MLTLYTSAQPPCRPCPEGFRAPPVRGGGLVPRRHSRLQATALLATLLLLPAFALAAGPSIYNPQTTAMSVDINFANGDEFRNVINSNELKVLGSDAQITSVQVYLSNGVLTATESDTPRLRGSIARPGDQVWVVDGVHICVVSVHKFKRKLGFKCAGH